MILTNHPLIQVYHTRHIPATPHVDQAHAMDRRQFLESLPTTAAGVQMTLRAAGAAPTDPTPGATPDDWREHFPALRQQVNGAPLCYLDTAATALRPAQVIDAIADFYRGPNANPG